MQKFTCLTCRVSLNSADAQRDHYKHGWHIYNLKRKLSNMIPITEVDYDRVLEQHTDKVDSVPVSRYCDSCRKNFTSEKAFLQHNTSKKHITMLEMKNDRKAQEKKRSSGSESSVSQDEDFVIVKEEKPQLIQIEPAGPSVPTVVDEEMKEEDDVEFESIPVTECLFCSQEAATMEKNIEHMSTVHSFFMPDIDYCCDLEGMLNYLGMKIASGRECLYCSEFGKQFASKKSAQQHMLDKGHARIKYDYTGDSLEEFEDFYDYTASYPVEGDDDEVEEDEMQLVPEDYQLRLPSGAVIGHRSLLVYYKQNLRPQAQERRSKNKELVSKVMSQYQMLGWTGITSEGAKRRAKDIQHWQRRQQRASLAVGQAANKTATMHFRCQTGFC